MPCLGAVLHGAVYHDLAGPDADVGDRSFPGDAAPLPGPLAAVPGATQDRGYRGPPVDRVASRRASPDLSSSGRLTRPLINSRVVPTYAACPVTRRFFPSYLVSYQTRDGKLFLATSLGTGDRWQSKSIRLMT